MSDEHDRRRSVALVVLVGLAVLCAPMIAASEHATMSVADATVTNGETATVAVTLSEAPDGLAGFDVIVEVDDPGTATISDAAVDSGMSPSNASIASDGASVQLRAADGNKQFQAGDGPFTVATVSLRSEAVGETTLGIAVDQVDDDDGSRIDPAVDGGRLTVTTADDETPTETETDTGDSGTGGDTGGDDPGGDDPTGGDDGSTGDGGAPPAGGDGNDGGSSGGRSSGDGQSGGAATETTTRTATPTATQTVTESSTPTGTPTLTATPTPTSVTTQEPTVSTVTTREQTATDTASTTVSNGTTAMENDIGGGAEAPTSDTGDGGVPFWLVAVVVVGAGAGIYRWRQQP